MTDVQFIARVVVLAVSLWVSSCSPSKPAATTEPIPAAELKPYRACMNDAECVIAQNGCCDCANGGDDIAVARDKAAAFRALFSCQGVGCTEMDREPACGTGTVACEAGLCVFHEAEP